MHIDARTRRILAGITREEWEALAIFSREMANNFQNVFKDGKVQVNEFNQNELNEIATNLLEKVGAQTHLSGYLYFKDAIMMLYADESYSKSMNKRLFSDIGKKHKVSAGAVASSIENFLKPIFSQKNCEALERIYSCYPLLKEKHSTKYAIPAFAGYIRKFK